MATSPSSSAQQARQAIADRLREILRDSGLTARALARQAGWDETKCSRLIHGRTPPSDEDIRTWCTICDLPDEIPNLIAASRNAESAYMEWRRVQRSQTRMQKLRLDVYEGTQFYRIYCNHVLPWPVQTPAYMRALMEGFNSFHQGAATDISEAIKARQARQQLLKDGTRRCAMVIEETVLRDRFADNDVIRQQLQHLLACTRRTSLSLGIIPFGAARSAYRPTETFSIYGDEMVVVELVGAAVNITQPREINLYAKAFNDLTAVAVHGEAARVLIANALDALR
ncbi:helix-turn-helix domain-containing protein [Nonomuraea rubra]|uniref:helix-turn-helix domain-containing protein n=1 Tax=Nonomuraea rubra TaxID=46180 RepID=UPI0033EC13B2